MLLQTNSYIVPKDKRAEHQRLLRRFRQTLKRLGCDHFEVYEQVGPNWSASESSGRYVQILRFSDRKHQLAVQQAERSDPSAQAVISDFCDLINFPYQQQQGLFAVGFYNSALPVAPVRGVKGDLISTVEHEVVEDEADGPATTVVVPTGPVDESTLVADESVEHSAAAAAMAAAAAEPVIVDRPREMIDSVLIDHGATAPGELYDVLGAHSPVHGLEGTPPETVPLIESLAVESNVPGGDSPEPAGDPDHLAVPDEDDEAGHAYGFVLEDAADAAGHQNGRAGW